MDDNTKIQHEYEKAIAINYKKQGFLVIEHPRDKIEGLFLVEDEGVYIGPGLELSKRIIKMFETQRKKVRVLGEDGYFVSFRDILAKYKQTFQEIRDVVLQSENPQKNLKLKELNEKIDEIGLKLVFE